MALAPRRSAIPLDGSLAQHVAPEVIRPPNVRRLINGRWNKVGQIEKRLGTNPYPLTRTDGSGSIATHKKLFSRESQLNHIDGHFVDSFIGPDLQWQKQDRVPEALLDRFPILGNYTQGNLKNASIAYSSFGYLCIVFGDQDNAIVTAVVVDEGSDAIVSITALSPFAMNPRVVTVDGNFYAAWPLTATNVIKCAIFDTATLTWSALTSIVTTNANSTTNWDMVADDSASAFFVVNDRSTGQLDLRRFNAALTETHNALDARTGKTTTRYALHEEGSRLYLALSNNTDSRVESIGFVSADLTSGYTVQTVQSSYSPFGTITVGQRTAGNAWVLWEVIESAATPAIAQSAAQWKTISSAGTVTATLHETRNVRLASRVFVYDGHSYITIATAFPGGEQFGLTVVDLGNDYIATTDYRMRPIARWADGELYDQFGVNHLSAVAVGPLGQFWVAFAMKDFEIAGVSRGISIEYDKLRLDDPLRWQIIPAARGAMVPAGFPHAWDGVNMFEAGFSWYPWIQSIGLVAGGSLQADYQYEFVACYVWTDVLGRTWRSTPSTSRTITPTGGNLSVQLAIPNYTVTSMTDFDGGFRNPAGIEVYIRNNGDPTGVLPAPTTLLEFTRAIVAASDPLAANFTLITIGSEPASTNPFLYTNGDPAPLDNEVPPPFLYMVEFDTRIVAADRRRVWYTKELDPQGVFGAFWNSTNSFLLDEGGDTTALSVQDYSCIIWKLESVYYFQGHGPDDTGLNNAFTTPTRVATDDGCVNARSIAVTPVGTFYLSGRGIMLLDRQLQTDYVGAAIEDELALFADIRVTTVHPAESEVRFWCKSSFGDNDFRMLVYDYLRRRWCVRFYFPHGDQLDLGKGAETALMHTGQYLWAEASGFIFAETGSQFGDDDGVDQSFVQLDEETADISLDGFAGFQRIWYLTLTGRALYTDHTKGPKVQVDIWIDYASKDATPDCSFSFTQGQADQAAFPMVQYRMHMPFQNCQAIRVRVRDVEQPADPFNASVAWQSLMLEYGVETGRGRFPALQRA
jgi:hypothetical protein